MRALVQRVTSCEIEIDRAKHSSITKGLLILIGIEDQDTQEDIEWLCRKIVNMRIFEDEQGVMNKSAIQENLQLMVVSQFTLHASTKKGNRPSYIKASKPDFAIPMYEAFVKQMEDYQLIVKTGIFGADMKIHLTNDGPVTIFIDTKQRD